MKTRQSKKLTKKTIYPKYKIKRKPVLGDPLFINNEHYIEALKEWRRKRELNNMSVRLSRQNNKKKIQELTDSVKKYKGLYEEIKEQYDRLFKLYEYQLLETFNEPLHQEEAEAEAEESSNENIEIMY